MPKFSERVGAVPARDFVQISSMNSDLYNSLWNIVHTLFDSGEFTSWRKLARNTAMFFFKVPVDEVSEYEVPCMDWVKAQFFNLEWFRVYDFIEHIHVHMDSLLDYTDFSKNDLEEMFNFVLEDELSGYRFLNGQLAPISSEEEIKEVNNAIEQTSDSRLLGAKKHLETAIELLSTKPQPDYRNSIKESISAVESVAKVLSGVEKGGLAGALGVLESNTHIHGALKSAFLKLYGYTSDEDGVRHAILGESDVGFDEAKFMLVSCSAFVNFLISKSQKAGN